MKYVISVIRIICVVTFNKRLYFGLNAAKLRHKLFVNNIQSSIHFFEGLFDFPSEKLNWADNKKKNIFKTNNTPSSIKWLQNTQWTHTTTPFSLFQLLAIKPKTFIIYSLQVVIFDLSSIILHSVWTHRGATKTHIK